MADLWGQLDSNIRGGADVWDDGLVGEILRADYFAPGEITGAGNGSMAFAGTGEGVVRITCAADGAVSLTGASTGNVLAQGGGDGTVALTGAATGLVVVNAGADGSLSLIGTASGELANLFVTGTVSGSLTFAGSMAGFATSYWTSAVNVHPPTVTVANDNVDAWGSSPLAFGALTSVASIAPSSVTFETDPAPAQWATGG